MKKYHYILYIHCRMFPSTTEKVHHNYFIEFILTFGSKTIPIDCWSCKSNIVDSILDK